MGAKTHAMLALIALLPFIECGEIVAIVCVCKNLTVCPGSCRGASWMTCSSCMCPA